jgi:hypothetical protein
MNKLILILGICFISITAWSQSEDEKDGFNLPNGIRFGWQSSNFIQDGETAEDNLDRGYIGYVRKVSIAHFFKLETGLEYMIAGTQINDDTKLQLHYLVLPAQGALKIGPFVAQAGVSANFRIAEDYRVDGESIERDDKSAGFDVAANVGAGFNFLFMTLEARHYWGLLEVENGWYNDYWQLGLKFNF